MAYLRNIPAATDLISNSQSQIQGNFQIIDSGSTGTGTGFSRNHVTMTDATNGGLHNRVDFYQAVSAPAISGFTSSAYAKTANSDSQLFYKNGTAEMQITNSALSAASAQGMLPGGLQIRCGTANSFSADNSNHAIAISPAFPTNSLFIFTSASNSDYTHAVQTAAVNASSFNAKSNNGGTINFTWLAIGY